MRWETEALRDKGMCGAIDGKPPNERACILPEPCPVHGVNPATAKDVRPIAKLLGLLGGDGDPGWYGINPNPPSWSGDAANVERDFDPPIRTPEGKRWSGEVLCLVYPTEALAGQPARTAKENADRIAVALNALAAQGREKTVGIGAEHPFVVAPYAEQSEEWRRGYDEADMVNHHKTAELRSARRIALAKLQTLESAVRAYLAWPQSTPHVEASCDDGQRVAFENLVKVLGVL